MSEIELKANIEDRIRAAISRITSGHGCMRIPAEETDPDLVLADCLAEIKRLRAQWQPIESAPKAKTPMVVVIGVWGSYVTDPYAVFWNGTGWARWPHKAAPTHWLRLPAPPEVP